MRSLSPSYIAASVLIALGAASAAAQSTAFTRATGTNGSTVTTNTTSGTTGFNGSTVTTSNTNTSRSGTGLTTQRSVPSAELSQQNPASRASPAGGLTGTTTDTSTSVTSSGTGTNTVRTTNADGSSVFVDTTRTLRSTDAIDSGNGVDTVRVTNGSGDSTFVETATTVRTNDPNAGLTTSTRGSNTGISPGQSSSGSAAGASSGGVTGADASLTQNGLNGFGTGANTEGVATNGAIIPPGGFLAGSVAVPAFGGTATGGVTGSASATDGGNMFAAGEGSLGNGGTSVSRSGAALLDEDARREKARTRATVSRGGQMLHSVTPRTDVDRSWQMPDDNSPLLNGTRR